MTRLTPRAGAPDAAEAFPTGAGELLALIPDAALAVDAAGVVRGANSRALDLLAAPRDGVVGRPASDFVTLPVLGGEDVVHARLVARRATDVPVLVEASLQAIVLGGERHWLCSLHELSLGTLTTEAQRHFDVAFDASPIGMALFNPDGEYIRVNAALCTMLGRSAADLLGRRDQELTHPDDRAADVAVAWEILEGRRSTHQVEKRFLHADGSVVWVIANLTFLRDDAGRPLSWVGQFQDITARRATEQALRDSEERFRSAFDHAPIGIALVAPDGRWLRVNRQLCEMTGYEEDALLGGAFQDITHPDDLELDLEQVQAMLAGRIRTYEMEKRYFRADGSVLWVLLSVSLVRDAAGEPLYFVSQLQDIDERMRAHSELERLARHDPLTGTLNRRAWDEELGSAVSRSGKSGDAFGIVLMDVNHFKQVNDNLGHQAGDILLQQAVQAWQRQLRGTDLLARIGGDEFAVLVPTCSATVLAAVAERLRRGLQYVPGCAVGAACWTPGDSADDLMARADRALYADKAATQG